jgi:pimeloyl-ACP methyl ester carboxylesterase
MTRRQSALAMLGLASALVCRGAWSQALAPQGHLAPVNGAQLYYEDYGTGSPLVLLHYFGSSSAVWAPFIPEFAKQYRVIAIDLRGHGRSTNPSGQFSHRKAALDVFALLDRLGVTRFKAIGASSGAMTLIHMATEQPPRVEAMVLVGGTDQFVAETRAILKDPTCEQLTEEDWQRMRALHHHGDEQIRELQREFCGFRNSYDDMNFTPPFLSTITARTLIVHGDHDGFFPVRIPMEIYTAIPHAFLWIVPNGGHLPVFAPKMHDAFVATALEFLGGVWERKP